MCTSSDRRMPHRTREEGLTLVELVIAIVVISVAVVGVLQVMRLVTRNSVDPQMRKQALAVAEAVLEEVELMPFTDCDPSNYLAGVSCTSEGMGPEPGETRGGASPFDNVNDYNSLTLAATSNDLNNSGTVRIPVGYTAQIAVATDANLGPAASLIPAADSLRITVTVTYNNGNDHVTLEGYRTRYAPTAMP